MQLSILVEKYFREKYKEVEIYKKEKDRFNCRTRIILTDNVSISPSIKTSIFL